MNLGEIESTLYDRFGFKPNPEAAVVRRVRREINDAHMKILGKRAFSRLRRQVLPTASVANSPFMALPQAATKIVCIADRTNQRNLTPISLQDVRYRDPGLLFTGSIPENYAVINFSAPTFLQPSAAALLSVSSTDNTDTGGIVAYVEGIDEAGIFQFGKVALTGTTVAALAPAVTYVVITKFYITGTGVGSVKLMQGVAGGTVLSYIPPGRTASRYTIVHLSDIPSTAITYYCDVELHVSDMNAISDEPLLPEDFHWMLECGAACQELIKREKVALWKIEMGNWVTGIADLRAWLTSSSGVAFGGQRASKQQMTSQLGAYYPAGS